VSLIVNSTPSLTNDVDPALSRSTIYLLVPRAPDGRSII
jgi:hypothetical protein